MHYRVKLFLAYQGVGYHRGELVAVVEGYAEALAKAQSMGLSLPPGWFITQTKVERCPDPDMGLGRLID